MKNVPLPVEGSHDDADKVAVHALPAALRPEVDVRRLHRYPGVGVVPSQNPEACLVLGAGINQSIEFPHTFIK